MWSPLSCLSVLPGDFLSQGGGVRWVKLDTQTHGEWRLRYEQKTYISFRVYHSNRLCTFWKINKAKQYPQTNQVSLIKHLHFICLEIDFVNSNQCCREEKETDSVSAKLSVRLIPQQLSTVTVYLDSLHTVTTQRQERCFEHNQESVAFFFFFSFFLSVKHQDSQVVLISEIITVLTMEL